MGKRKSYCVPGAVHELTFSTYENARVFDCPRCAQIVVDEIFAAKQRLDFSVPAYVVMPTHVHLLVFPHREEYSIPSILFAIKKPASRRILTVLQEEGSAMISRLSVQKEAVSVRRVWQAGGGYDRVFTDIDALQLAVEYIHNNPVKAGLCEAQSEFLFSSARAMAEGDFSLIDPLPY